jgi:hypothetical protein
MKKSDLLKLLEPLDADANIYYSYRVGEYDADVNDDFDVFCRYEIIDDNTIEQIPIYIITPSCLSDLCNYITPEEKLKRESLRKLLEIFPKKKHWTTTSNFRGRAELTFTKAGFKRVFIVSSKNGQLYIDHFSNGKSEEFDSWDEFFGLTKPEILKQLQKYREELEAVFEEGIDD